MFNILPKQIRWRHRFRLVICLLLFLFNSSIAQNIPGFRQLKDARYNVLDTAFSPDGQILAISRGTGDPSQRSGQIDLWEVETGKLKQIIRGFDGPVWSVSFSADGQTLISGSSEFRYTNLQGDLKKGKFFSEIKWWDVATGELKFKQTNQTDQPRTLMTATTTDGKLLANAEFYTQTNTLIATPIDAGGSGPLLPSTNFPFINSLRTSMVDVNLLNAQTGTVNRQLKGALKSNSSTFRGISPFPVGPTVQPGGIALSPSGDLIAVGMPEEVRIWNTQTGEMVMKLKKFKGRVRSLSFSPDGQTFGIASVTSDSKRSGDILTLTYKSEINFYQVPTGQLIKNIKYNGIVSSLSFLRQSRGLLIGVTEFEENRAFNRLKHLSLETGEISRFVDRQRDTGSFLLSPNEQTIAFIDGRLRVTLWDLKTRRAKFNFDEVRDEDGSQNTTSRYVLDIKRVLSVSFSADGKTLAAGTEGNEIKLWDPRTGAFRKKLTGHEGRVSGIALAADGQHLVSSSDDETVRLWNLQTGAQEGVLASDIGSTAAITVSPDGLTVVGSNGNNLLLWDVQNRRLQKTLESSTPSPIIAVIFSADGQNLLAASENGLIQVWDVRTGQIIKSWQTTDKITNISLAPDGRILASATDDGLVSIWNARTGDLIKNLDKHDLAVNSLAFSPDGKWMASGGDDRKIFVWETSTWKSKRTMKGIDLTVTSLAFSPDGEFLASGSGNMSVVLWNVETGKLERILK